jgi:hypothetical protein
VTIVMALVAVSLSRPAAADGVRLQVQAGVGGVVRPSRWLPVRITLENSGADVSGELLVEWGEARLHRDVSLAAPSRLDLELYVRAGDVRSNVIVRLLVSGTAVATVRAPVRIAGDAEVLSLCVAPGGSSSTDVDCTVTLAPNALPRSARGYDAVDRVAFVGGAGSALAQDQRAALERWRWYHTLETEDLLSSVPPPSPAATTSAQGPTASVLAAASVYLFALLAASTAWWQRLRPRYAYGCVVLVLVLASAGTVWAGRVGPGSAIVLRHATTVQQVADASLVTLRGSVEYPAFAQYALRSTVGDGALTDRLAPVLEQWVDAAGFPVRRGTFGRGAREEVEFEGITSYAPFRVVATGDVVRVVNASDRPLSDCRFTEGFSRTGMGDLLPGAAVEARALGRPDGPFFVCEAGESPVSFVDPRFAVRSEGVTQVSVRLPVAAASGDLK